MEENNNTPHPYKPISCPRCGSVNLAFVAEYHKAILLKLISDIVWIVIFSLVIADFTNAFQYIVTGKDYSILEFDRYSFLLVIQGFLSLFKYTTESQTHTKAICRDCGNTWLHD